MLGLYDLTTGKVLAEMPQSREVIVACFAASKKRARVGCWFSHDRKPTIEVWDFDSGIQHVQSIREEQIARFRFASDGDRLVLETSWRVFIVDVSSRRVLWEDDLLSPLTKSFARCTGQTAEVSSRPPVPAWPQCTATVLVTPDAKHVVQVVSNSQRRDFRGGDLFRVRISP